MKKMQEKWAWVWLSLIPNLGPKKKKILLEKYKRPNKIYAATKKELLEIEGIGERIAEEILNQETRKSVSKHLEYMEKNNINIISIEDEEYPKVLKEIYDPPISLYIKGDKTILNQKAIAIVGCRDATEYGKKASKYFAYNLANEKINIVSGLARGIDSYSHIGCLVSNVSKTIAVLGNGLDTIYPSENKILADKIIENGGAIISEYPLGTKPEKENFPARNRIISGMSQGVLVVEAKEKSGTLITVDFALEQGREVYVVPGNINLLTSVGTNNLIKQGAKLVTNYRDILDE